MFICLTLYVPEIKKIVIYGHKMLPISVLYFESTMPVCVISQLFCYTFIATIYKQIFSSGNFLIPLINEDTLASFVSVRTLGYVFLKILILTFILK
jgi:hypothetical protein